MAINNNSKERKPIKIISIELLTDGKTIYSNIIKSQKVNNELFIAIVDEWWNKYKEKLNGSSKGNNG